MPAGALHGGGHEAPRALGDTPGLVVEAAPLRSLCQSSSRRRAGRSKEALPLFSPASRARRRAHASLVHHQDTRRQAEQAAFDFSTPRSPAPLKSAATAVWHAGLRSCRPARVSGGPVWGHGRVLAHGIQRDGELARLESAISLWGTDRTAVFSAPFGERRSNDSGRLNSGWVYLLTRFVLCPPVPVTTRSN